MGTVLRAPGRTWASHRSAATLWRIASATPLRPEVSTTARLKAGGATVHRVDVMPVEDRSRRAGIAVTSPERTLVDLAGVITPVDLEAAIVAALQTGLTTAAQLGKRGAELSAPGRRGSGGVARVLESWGGGPFPESPLEGSLLRLFSRHRLPEPARQWEVWDGGRLVGRVDFAYPERRIAIEADGYRWHAGAATWRSDLSRRNALTQAGWRVLHFTWDDVHRRQRHVARTIAAALSGPDVPGNGTKVPESQRAT